MYKWNSCSKRIPKKAIVYLWMYVDNTRCNFNNLLLMIKIGILSTKKLFLFLFFFFFTDSRRRNWLALKAMDDEVIGGGQNKRSPMTLNVSGLWDVVPRLDHYRFVQCSLSLIYYLYLLNFLRYFVYLNLHVI